ncbi:hypothetical protein [Nocardia aurantia]|uniref:Uncharacterized protein n=1 Tax=Nocardia aurantia TaxID=2585199 RepID=A0A7K0DPV0_9NOCA|nr:hypothetical protein [Nocardia aurantia]MQY27790.1 hypothetical protein [Nocardia aurantia]
MNIHPGMRLMRTTTDGVADIVLVHAVRYGPLPYAEISDEPDGNRRSILLAELERQFPEPVEPGSTIAGGPVTPVPPPPRRRRPPARRMVRVQRRR